MIEPLDETGNLRMGPDVWRSLAAVALILAVAPVIALAATWGYTAASGAGLAGVVRPGVLAERQALQSVVYFAALHGSVLVLTLLATARIDSARLGGLLGASMPAPRYAKAALLVVAGGSLWLGFLFWLMPGELVAETGDFARYVRSGWGALLFPVLTLLAPLAEEALFRGVLFRALGATVLGAFGAALASSALWAALHVGTSPLVRVHLVVAGMGLCWLVKRTGSLRLAIFVHVLFNSALGLFLVMSVPD